jgi:hypothetical protein
MPTIRIEYEVPDDDCWKCSQSYSTFNYVRRCTLFNVQLHDVEDRYKYQRCQACIDAEVKVQPE